MLKIYGSGGPGELALEIWLGTPFCLLIAAAWLGREVIRRVIDEFGRWGCVRLVATAGGSSFSRAQRRYSSKLCVGVESEGGDDPRASRILAMKESQYRQ